MIEMVIEQRRGSLGGGVEVGRVLPYAKRRIRPLHLLDHTGPLDLTAGVDRSVDVRPHPHIGLSTVTYLFAGEMMHRDSVGSTQAVRPQEVNWMTAAWKLEEVGVPAGPINRLDEAFDDAQRFGIGACRSRSMACLVLPARSRSMVSA